MNLEKNNKLVIISSPSGAGKTTLCKLLLKKINNISLSISYTSRSKRLNEKHGKDYYFVSEKKIILETIMDLLLKTLLNLKEIIKYFYLILIGKGQEK